RLRNSSSLTGRWRPGGITGDRDRMPTGTRKKEPGPEEDYGTSCQVCSDEVLLPHAGKNLRPLLGCFQSSRKLFPYAGLAGQVSPPDLPPDDLLRDLLRIFPCGCRMHLHALVAAAPAAPDADHGHRIQQ